MVAVCFHKPGHLLENAAGIPRSDLRVPERGKGERRPEPSLSSWQGREGRLRWGSHPVVVVSGGERLEKATIVASGKG